MTTDIQFKGITGQASDRQCPDGELAAALNLIPDDGALRPVTPPQPLTDSNGTPLNTGTYTPATDTATIQATVPSAGARGQAQPATASAASCGAQGATSAASAALPRPLLIHNTADGANYLCYEPGGTYLAWIGRRIGGAVEVFDTHIILGGEQQTVYAPGGGPVKAPVNPALTIDTDGLTLMLKDADGQWQTDTQHAFTRSLDNHRIWTAIIPLTTVNSHTGRCMLLATQNNPSAPYVGPKTAGAPVYDGCPESTLQACGTMPDATWVVTQDGVYKLTVNLSAEGRRLAVEYIGAIGTVTTDETTMTQTQNEKQCLSAPIVDARTIGHLLCVSTAEGMIYIRYDSDSDCYRWLGSMQAPVRLDFSLNLDFRYKQVNSDLARMVNKRTSGVTDDDLYRTVCSRDFDTSVPMKDNMPEGFGIPDIDTYKPDMGFSFWDWWNNFSFGILKHQPVTLNTPAGGLKKGNSYRITLRVDAAHRGTHWVAQLVYGSEHITEYSQDGYVDIGPRTKSIIYGSDEGNIQSMIFVADKDYAASSLSVNIYGAIKKSDVAKNGFVGHFTIEEAAPVGEGVEQLESWYLEYNKDSYEALLAETAKITAAWAADRNRFIHPFFVRYAVRMWDGSHCYVSDPALMIPNSDVAPLTACGIGDKDLGEGAKGTLFHFSAFTGALTYRINGQIADNWRELIAGIDIYVSQPIQPCNAALGYDARTSRYDYSNPTDRHPRGFGYITDSDTKKQYNTGVNAAHTLMQYSADAYGTSSRYHYMAAGRYTDAERSDITLNRAAAFYKIGSINTDDIKTASTFRELKIEAGALCNLVTREQLNDDVLTYDNYAGCQMTEYNSRLHLYGGGVRFRKPSSPLACSPASAVDARYTTEVVVSINTGNGVVYSRESFTGQSNLQWYYYPDSRASQAQIIIRSGSDVVGYTVLKLKPHPFLPGSYWLTDNFDQISTYTSTDTAPTVPGAGREVPVPNTLYVSEAENPMVFRAEGVTTLGAKVLSLATAAKALSQGQFGQFPLYAFTADGIWALSTGGEGLYQAVQPLSRDVCIHPENITQIDGAVLFTTARGVMLLQGSQIECLTEQLGMYPPVVMQHPDMRMVYDYSRRWLVLYCTDHSETWLLNLRTRQWGMADWGQYMADTVRSWPDAMVIATDGTVHTITPATAVASCGAPGATSVTGLDRASGPSAASASTGPDRASGPLAAQAATSSQYIWLRTRPIKLGAPDTLKTVTALLLRGTCQLRGMDITLQVSNDLRTWHHRAYSNRGYLTGLAGSGWKYLRIIIGGYVSPYDTLEGLSIDWRPRDTHRLR